MFCHLSKRLALPDEQPLASISWNSAQGWIAFGGKNGLLKVVKLGSASAKRKAKPEGKTHTLDMKQSLDGHSGWVKMATWNEQYDKLTTCDEEGLIIVWMLHDGLWFEEMVNKLKGLVVSALKWTPDGSLICIVYKGGTVIVGKVDGNRLWSKKLGLELTHVEWSPDGRHVLFGTDDSRVVLYTRMGESIGEVENRTRQGQTGPIRHADRLIDIQWYAGQRGYLEPNVPRLCIAYANGRLQILRGLRDQNPVLINTEMKLTAVQWNPSGSILAVGGSIERYSQSAEAMKSQAVVQFYTPYGKHMWTMKVNGSGVTDLAWEGNSLRLAMAVDNVIFFATIRQKYEWGYFSNCLVYSFTRPGRSENCVCFWDTVTDVRHEKYLKELLKISAAGEHCVFATRNGGTSGKYILILCNAIGSPVDSKYVDVEPEYITMTEQHVIVASHSQVYMWQYRTAVSQLTSLVDEGGLGDSLQGRLAKRKEGRESMFHVDSPPSYQRGPGSKSRQDTSYLGLNQKEDRETKDPITGICASKSTLIICRASGTIMRLSLPQAYLQHSYTVQCRPKYPFLNCNSTKLAVIDNTGQVLLLDLDARPNGSREPPGQILDFKRTNCWDLRWSSDNPDMFATMEKSRMYVIRGTQPEEPVSSNGYLCEFKDLCIKSAVLDEIIQYRVEADKDLILEFETKSLRVTRELLATASLQVAQDHVEASPHPRLWQKLAEAALFQLDFDVADRAFVQCHDYQGIQFVKMLKRLQDKRKQEVEVLAYFRRFEEAHQKLLEADAREDAIELRVRMGDWFRVEQMLREAKSEGSAPLVGQDKLTRTTYNSIGDYFQDRQVWSRAFEYYSRAENLPQMANCAYALDDYDTLRKLIHRFPEHSPHLNDLGDKFVSVGCCDEAVKSYVRAGSPKKAIECCMLLNQWADAVQLAETHNVSEIEELLTQYATYLLSNKELCQAVQLYRKAHIHLDAAKLLFRLAADQASKKTHILRAKQLYVLGAFEAEQLKQKTLSNARRGDNSGGSGTSGSIIDSLVEHDMKTGSQRSLEAPWHGAEALHFYMLAQRQLYSGNYNFALRTAYRLVGYEGVVGEKEVHGLLALAAIYTRHYGIVSRAFIKLEQLEGALPEEDQRFKKLALKIFVKHPPRDAPGTAVKCPACQARVMDHQTSCDSCGKSFPPCVASGHPIHDTSLTWRCGFCKHRALREHMKGRNTCPLCHGPTGT